jgi:asparagine synthase (glutamine-hydrolysing)
LPQSPAFSVCVFRYIALLWDSRDLQQSHVAQTLGRRLRAGSTRWQDVCVHDGLRVFHAGANAGSLDAQVLPQAGGLLLGAVFERNHDVLDEATSRRWSATSAQAEAIAASRGRWLIEHCWGNYVAILADPAGRHTWVLKDPTGELQCCVTTFQSVTVIFSRLSDLLALGPFTFRVDPAYLRARLLYGGGDLGRTALEGVEQVGRGECIEIARESRSGPLARRSYWHPSVFAETPAAIENSDLAARAIRATLRAATHTLAAGHASLLLRLSGGLDSSIIAACLRGIPGKPRVCSYTYYNPRGRSDERPWARLSARRVGCEHVESPIAPNDLHLEHVLSLPPSVEPTPLMAYLLRSTLEQKLADERGASAVFCGDGGDSGFCAESFAYSVSEYLHRHGMRREVLRLASRVALSTEQSSWSVLYRAVRRWQRGSGMEQLNRTLVMASRLLSDDLRESLPGQARYPHPWFADRDRVPWATIRRLGTLLAAPQSYDVAPDVAAPELIAPLYAQPVLELLLRIPVYVHFEGGRERGLARRAFATDLPPEITRRLWKDRAPGFYDELLDRNRGFLRHVLLDGVLVREGLLDRRAVAETLSDAVVKNPVLPGEVFRHLDVEIWARNWVQSAATGSSKSLAEPDVTEASL